MVDIAQCYQVPSAKCHGCKRAKWRVKTVGEGPSRNVILGQNSKLPKQIKRAESGNSHNTGEQLAKVLQGFHAAGARRRRHQAVDATVARRRQSAICEKQRGHRHGTAARARARSRIGLFYLLVLSIGIYYNPTASPSIIDYEE